MPYQTISALHIGTVANRVNIGVDGTITLEGAATVFDDVAGQLTGSSLFSTAGKADYDFDESCVVFQPSGSVSVDGDCVVISMQMPHSAKVDSPLYLHLHYEQADASIRSFTFQYRVQKNGSAKTTAWSDATTTNTTDAGVLGFTYISGTINQIIKLGQIPLISAGLSAVVQLRLTRSDATAGNVNVNFIDGHVEKDSMGSKEEYIK